MDAATKEALVGVNVIVPGTTTGTITDISGSFRINGQPDSLTFSMIGYKPKTIKTSSSMTVLLEVTGTSLNEVIVSASRDEQARTEAPVAISTLSRQLINETKPTSLEQVLNKVSGVYMVDLGNEQHTMAIRQPIGYKSLFLYMEDGIPIRTTGDFNHNALIEINMAALKSIEIIRGPASSLYGSEAIGGAVNFLTPTPSLLPTARIQLEASNQGYKRADFTISGTHKKLGLFLGGYYGSQRNGYREHSDFDKLALTFKADYRFSDLTRLITTATYIDYKTDQTGGLDSLHFYSKDYRSFYTFTYRSVDALRARTTLSHIWNETNSTNVSLFFRQNAIGQNPFYAIKSTVNPLKAIGEINEDSFMSYGSIIQHKKSFNFLKANLIGGISADLSPAAYRANFISIDKNTDGFYIWYTETDSLLTDYNVDLLNTAGYVQLDLVPVKKMKAIAAVRYDRLDYEFDNHLPSSAFTGAPDAQDHFEHFTPKVGVTHDLGKDRGVYANYSVGFAPPNITELYRGVKVPVLKPATYSNYETGGWFPFGKEKGYVDISLYQLDGINEIVSVRLPDGSYENQNAGRTQHRGIEYTVIYSPVKDVNLRVSGTNADHRFIDYIEKGIDYSGNVMNTAPRFIINSEITYKPRFLKGSRIATEWQHVGPYYMDAANTEEYDGYDLFNLRAGYRYKAFEGWMNVINLTDEVYATVVEKTAFGKSYRPGNLRTISFGLAYYFTGKIKDQQQ